MAALTAGLAAIAMVVPSPASAGTIAQWQPLIMQASRRFGVPEAWIERVMRAESGGQVMRDGRPIRSRAGAIGLMQLMPATWQTMRATLGLGDNPDDPRDNIRAGTFYLRILYARFGYPGLFAAYNAGPARYAAHLATGRPLPGETIAYLAKVGGGTTGVADDQAKPAPDTVFAVRHDRGVAAVPNDTASVFVVRHDGF